MTIKYRAVGRDFDSPEDAEAWARSEMAALNLPRVILFLIAPRCIPVPFREISR